MFSYCGNNPVSREDDGGEFWHLVIGAVVGGIIGGVSTAISGGDATDIFIGAVAGAASGLLAASGAGAVAQAVGSAAISMASNAGQQLNSIAKGETDEFDVTDMLVDGAVGLACGIAGGSGAAYGNSKNITKSGVRLTEKILSGSGKQAWNYYVKTAHKTGGKFVLTALKESLAISSIGTAVLTAKNLIIGAFV